MKAKNPAEWRKLVLERDNHTCLVCGSKENIITDHTEPQKLFPNLALETDNGRVLCRKCHRKYGKQVLSPNGKSSFIKIGGSTALIISPNISTGIFATIALSGPLLVIDPKGKLEKDELQQFCWDYVEPIFWKWLELKENK